MTDPPGRVRRDPRAERQRRTRAAAGAPGREADARPASPDVRVIDDPRYLVLAVPDLDDGALSAHDRDLLGAARLLADADGGAVLVLGVPAAERLGEAGADRVVVAPMAGPETRAAQVLAVIERYRPRHALFPDRVPGGGDVGRRVAARLGERAAANVRDVAPTQIVRGARGGTADVVQPPPFVLLLAPEVAEPVRGARFEARPLDAPEISARPRVTDHGPIAVDANALPLAETDFIVAAGNGVTDWDAFHRLARALNATEGGSRVVCDAGHLPRSRQVGASGTLVAPSCYLALGIAGAAQHLQGIARCERVVAVNTDLHADMVKRADLAVIADAQQVMPALAALVEREMGRR